MLATLNWDLIGAFAAIVIPLAIPLFTRYI
jgi:hypothetical protein